MKQLTFRPMRNAEGWEAPSDYGLFKVVKLSTATGDYWACILNDAFASGVRFAMLAFAQDECDKIYRDLDRTRNPAKPKTPPRNPHQWELPL